MDAPTHKMLIRQLRRATRPDGSVDLARLVSCVDATYFEHDLNLKRIDRANSLMAQELEGMLAIREAAAQDRAARIATMEQAQIAIEAREARVRHLAYHDILTGLPNRALLREKLAQLTEQMRQTGCVFAVHCIDLDNFKSVNDTFGHQTGDELVRIVAATLTAACGRDDMIARLGGDEFAIVQTNASEPEAAILAQRLVDAISQPIDLEVARVHIGCSIGVAIVRDSAEDPMEALRKADLALYAAKGEGRSRFVFFEPHMDAAVRVRRELQEDLRHAIDNRTITLAYQPQMGDAGEIVGIEALARWNHPERGIVPPSVFIPVAEEGGLIVDLGYYLLRQALSDSYRWPHLKVAVNVSAAQLRMKNFVQCVRSLVRETRANPKQFELEITESVLMGDDAETLETLRRLRALGFSLALDNFGTGYSSLSYLRHYPIDKIKIDRSFITNLGSDAGADAIISALIKLAHSLNMAVIAEGVETESQRASLSSAGCNYVQGFLFGRPMTADSIERLLGRTGPAARISA